MSSGYMTEKPAYPIESVDNALTLLRMFGEGSPVRVAEASDRIGVARSTAHRLLAMLQYHGFVRQDAETRAYVPGPTLLVTGLAAVRKLDIRQRARPALERLAELTGETIHMVMRQHADVLFLDGIESPKAVRVASRTGAVMPAHCTSVGKALLAEMSEEEVRRLYPNEELPRLTDDSIRSRSELELQLDQIRKRGYALSSGEGEIGVGSVGVAVPPLRSEPPIAISVSAPLERIATADHEAFADLCRECVRMIVDGGD